MSDLIFMAAVLWIVAAIWLAGPLYTLLRHKPPTPVHHKGKVRL